jgi:xanthine dehydrogenase small subunit
MIRTGISSLQVRRGRTLAEALALLREDHSLTPLAGCTDVYVAINAGTFPGRAFLDIWGLDELKGMTDTGDVLRIGALVTYSEIRQSPLVARWCPMLVEAAGQTGGVQIQNRGTLGGNVGNGSPAGDSLPVLAAMDAVVELRSAAGTRRVPFNEFYTGYRASVRRADELITAIELPRVEGRQWFRKVGTRAAQAISKVVVAAVRDTSPRVALGSVAPTVIRARRTEHVLAGSGDLAAARAVLDEEIAPIDDIRSTARYRRQVAGNLLARFWQETAP